MMSYLLKKMFSDRKLPLSMRARIPVLCDGRGILWVPFFGVRDDGEKKANGLTAVFLASEYVTPDMIAQIATGEE